MITIEPKIRMLIEDFLAQELKNRVGIETVVLCGSYATGKATLRSDIDLCYIGNFPDFKREITVHDKHEIQLMIAPWLWYEDVISNYERKEGNGGTITVMLTQGACIYGASEKWQQLSKLAKEFYAIGPCKASEKVIRSIRMQITGLFNNYSDQPLESTNRLWLAFHLVQCCIESQFKINSWWQVKPKYELSELQVRDSIMAELVDRILTTKDISEETIKNLCMHVLGQIGGFLD